jgi:predicted hotdog family 3-hydroxylacyl-ACP dehydratase
VKKHINILTDEDHMSLDQSFDSTESNKDLPQKAEPYIPHSGLMCVVDHLIEVGEKSAATMAVVVQDSPFAGQDGTVDETIFIEMVGQTIAAGNGFKMSEEERRNQQGFLIGIKNLRIQRPPLVGENLLIKASKSAEFAGFIIIEGSVKCGSEVLANGEIKVFQKIVEES